MADVGSKFTITKAKVDFAQAVSSEKHERIARRSLQDIIIFYQAVEKEMQKMWSDQAKGLAYDVKLLERLSAVKEQYKRVMTGFLELDDKSQHHALITFSDTIQDLMKYMHMRKPA